MTSLLRQIVAAPRANHPEAGFDLCYLTDSIIATSGPSSSYPQRAYRTPVDALVKFLDYKHDSKWAIWEFRAEGTGYPDSAVYNRIRHYPWPDHHPPPFVLIPNIMASMRDWLKGPDTEKGRVVVVHCKAGKGRSGTVSCSYLISEEGWTPQDAMNQFTAKRMRIGFGNGLSIPSQIRWVGYVDWWTKHGKVYVEREVEILEVHVHGLKDGVKVAVEGFVEEGKVIKTFHTFTKHERILMDAPSQEIEKGLYDCNINEETLPTSQKTQTQPNLSDKIASSASNDTNISKSNASAALFRPSTPIFLPTSDVNITFERRNKAKYGFTMVTSVAHVWFNIFFESQYNSTSPPQIPETDPQPTDPATLPTSGVFSIPWEGMDGIKGSLRKGTRALDHLSVVWRTVPLKAGAQGPSSTVTREKIISQPAPGAPIPEPTPADWRQAQPLITNYHSDKTLGLRTESPNGSVSRASSMASTPVLGQAEKSGEDDGSVAGSSRGVKSSGPGEEECISTPSPKGESERGPMAEEMQSENENGTSKFAAVVEAMKSITVGTSGTHKDGEQGEV